MNNMFYVWNEVKTGGDEFVVTKERSSVQEMECYLDDVVEYPVGDLYSDGFCFVQIDNNMLIWYREEFEKDLIDVIKDEYDYDSKNDLHLSETFRMILHGRVGQVFDDKG